MITGNIRQNEIYIVTRSTRCYQNCSQPSGVWSGRITHVNFTEEDLVWRNAPGVVSGAIRLQPSGSKWDFILLMPMEWLRKFTMLRKGQFIFTKLLTGKQLSYSTSALTVFLVPRPAHNSLLYCNPVSLVSVSNPVIGVVPWQRHSHMTHICVNVWMLVLLKPYNWLLFIT